MRKGYFFIENFQLSRINIIDENYEKIWRIIFIRRQKSIDDKLDQILRKYQ